MTNSKRSTSSQADSPANLFRLRVNGKLKPIRVGSGRSSYASCLRYDPASSSWRTYPDSSIEGWPRSSVIFPRAGTMLNGVAYRRPMWVRRTSGYGSSLWATPTVPLGGRSPAGGMSPTGMTLDGKKRQVDLRYQVKMAERGLWPTPKGSPDKMGRPRPNDRGDLQAAGTQWPTPTEADGMGGPGSSGRDGGPNLRTAVSGQLNPTWVEWLQGFPLGWTDLEDSETPSSPK